MLEKNALIKTTWNVLWTIILLSGSAFFIVFGAPLVFVISPMDATGLGFIIGVPIVIGGVVFYWFFLQLLVFLGFNDLIKIIINCLALFTITLMAILNCMSANNKNQQEYQNYEKRRVESLIKTQAEEDLLDQNILKQFEENNIVTIYVKYRTPDDQDFQRKIRESSLQQRQIINQQFAIENIISPIKKENIPQYKMPDKNAKYRSFRFYADVTKSGYQKLKENPYVRRMELFKN